MAAPGLQIVNPHAVIADLKRDGSGFAVQGDLDRFRLSVLEDIVERLLGDAVKPHFRLRREPADIFQVGLNL